MKLIYAQGFSKNEKLEWKPVVFSNVIQSFKTIQDAMQELHIDFEDAANEVRQRPLNAMHTDVAGGIRLAPPLCLTA
jgi:guanine nucleotide-binding protein subunit alpha